MRPLSLLARGPRRGTRLVEPLREFVAQLAVRRESTLADLPADLRWLFESGAVTIEQLATLHRALGVTTAADLADAVRARAVRGLPAAAGPVYRYAELDRPPAADEPHLLLPVVPPEVWAAGVTYERSREARLAETTTIGIYRPSTNTFHLRNSNTAGPDDLTILYGISGDTPLAGNWDGL